MIIIIIKMPKLKPFPTTHPAYRILKSVEQETAITNLSNLPQATGQASK